MLILFFIIGIIVILVISFLIIWQVRASNFKPNQNKSEQLHKLNQDLEPSGFAYDLQGDFFYSLMYCWQRQFGYCKLYDDAAPFVGMIIDCEPITFSYGGKKWLIEFWKGQYGITTGAEIGIYNTSHDEINTNEFHGTFYEEISDAERMPMSFTLKKNGKTILKRSSYHWWLTGFKLAEFSSPESLKLDLSIKFPNREMCLAFVEGLRAVGYRKGEFHARFNTVYVNYAIPHSKQPDTRSKMQESLTQQSNEKNCRLFDFATAKYDDTMDKLEFLKAEMPEMYKLAINSLYAKDLYRGYEIIKKILDGQKPYPPKPPCPPEPPYPPKPPCPPEPPCSPEPPYPPKPPCPPEPPCSPEPPCPPEPPCSPEPPCPPEPSCQPKSPCQCSYDTSCKWNCRSSYDDTQSAAPVKDYNTVQQGKWTAIDIELADQGIVELVDQEESVLEDKSLDVFWNKEQDTDDNEQLKEYHRGGQSCQCEEDYQKCTRIQK